VVCTRQYVRTTRELRARRWCTDDVGATRLFAAACFAALLAACTSSSPTELRSIAPTEAPPGAGAASARPASCDEPRQRDLLRSFFDAYNARDATRVLGTFGVAADATARIAGAYYDNVDGEAVQIQDPASLRSYLERRWALNDRFEVEVETIAVSARFPNPTFSFRRASDQGQYAGNAKFVCSGGVFSGLVTSSAATSRSECAETNAATGMPTNANTAAFSRRWYASPDRRIWASKPDRFYASGNKVLWERPSGEQLTVRGRPLTSTGPDLVPTVPSGYERFDYQASGIEFPVAGCWEIVARSGTSELRFVTEVYPQTYLPAGGSCVDFADAATSAHWVLTVQVNSNKPDRPGFIQHETTVTRSWRGDSTPVGHSVTIWQDALYEPVLERGGTYVVFLGVATFGAPNMQYGLTRIVCPLRTIIQVDGADVRRPAAYAIDQWIWKGSIALVDLERELSKL
jgi:hypothetical protein